MPGRQPRRPGQLAHRAGDPAYPWVCSHVPDRHPCPWQRWPVAAHLSRTCGGVMQTRALTVLIALALFTAAGVARAPGSWAAADSSSGGCGASGYPAGYGIWCQNSQGGTGTSGNPRTVADPGGSGVVNTPCALYPVPGNPTHMLRVCPLPNPNGGLRYAVN